MYGEGLLVGLPDRSACLLTTLLLYYIILLYYYTLLITYIPFTFTLNSSSAFY
jgi:hypothetical protein